jgi:transcription initiation factor TFIIIB Brf1 subunit/transcription initiation factor TFIIB
MGIREKLKEQAFDLSRRTMERLLADEKRAQAVAGALGTVQRGKRALDRSQDEMMRALQVASKTELKALGKALSALKRRARELDERLSAATPKRD